MRARLMCGDGALRAVPMLRRCLRRARFASSGDACVHLPRIARGGQFAVRRRRPSGAPELVPTERQLVIALDVRGTRCRSATSSCGRAIALSGRARDGSGARRRRCGVRAFATTLRSPATARGAAWRRARSPKQLECQPGRDDHAATGRRRFGPVSIVAGVQRNPSPWSVAASDRATQSSGGAELHCPRAKPRSDSVFSCMPASAPPAARSGVPSSSTAPRTWPGRGSRRSRRAHGARLDRQPQAGRRSARPVRRRRARPADPPDRRPQENSSLFPLPFGRGLIAWADREPGRRARSVSPRPPRTAGSARASSSRACTGGSSARRSRSRRRDW